MPTPFQSLSLGEVGWGGLGVGFEWMTERQLAQEMDGFEQRQKERWVQLCALVKGKVTLWVTSGLDTTTSATMETDLMNTCTERLWQITEYLYWRCVEVITI